MVHAELSAKALASRALAFALVDMVLWHDSNTISQGVKAVNTKIACGCGRQIFL